MPGPGLLDELTEVVGRVHVLATDDLVAAHTSDWTGRWHGTCTAVVRPGSTGELAGVISACVRHGAPVVPQGGNTGLVGGAVPHAPAVVVSTARLDQVGPVDTVAGQVTVGAGATIAEVQQAAAASGWRYPVDFAARDTATVGGSIATNAGGHHVLRHGMTRRHVLGIEAVLADGSVVSHLGGLVKDNTGYDLPGLFCGSEGTLGIVTAARLALVPAVESRVVALVGFDGLDSVVAAIAPLRRDLDGLEALEVMTAGGLEAVGRHLGRTPPLPGAAAVLLVEVVGDAVTAESLGEVVAGRRGVLDAAVATDERAAVELWRWRDAHTEMINATGTTPPHKFDVTVPLGAIPGFAAEVHAVVHRHRPDAQVWIFGHAGDGNIHVNVTGVDPDDAEVDAVVYDLVAAAAGSISAEHGIGRAKRSHLHLSRSPEEIEVFRAIKAALDPAGVFNPGVLLPDA